MHIYMFVISGFLNAGARREESKYEHFIHTYFVPVKSQPKICELHVVHKNESQIVEVYSVHTKRD